MKRTLVLIPLLSCLCWAAFSQEDNVGAGRGLTFDGVDDYIILDHSYPTLNLPFSVSAWVMLDAGFAGASPIFVTNDNNPIYRGFWFAVGPNYVQCEIGDGTGGNNPSFRRGKLASVSNIAGRWVHITAVMKSVTNIELYVNGINVGGTLSGESSLTMASSYVSDQAKIGYFNSNNVTYLMHGVVDEIRLWNRGLTQEEVRGAMCRKLIGNESGLVGYWTFNELSGTTVGDKSASGNNGHFMGNPMHVFSGAPIGDKSIYSYPSLWAGSTFAIKDGNDSLVVSNVTGSPDGIQLYEVFDKPSQVTGLDLGKDNKPYFGVYLASLDVDDKFDILSCSLYDRDNNSVANWNHEVNMVQGINQRKEFVEVVSNLIPFDLGPIRVLCDSVSTLISTGLTTTGITFKWSTGETTPSIVVHESGTYKVDVTESCGVLPDSIQVFFLHKPAFTLGMDTKTCSFNTTVLTPIPDPTGFSFRWQDGSTQNSYVANTFGSYWVTVSGYCGGKTDTIKFTKIPKEVIQLELGPDKLVCDATSTLLSSGIVNPNVSFKWNTGETTPEIMVSQSGEYQVKVIQTCDVTTDNIQVTILDNPPVFSIGIDEGSCPFTARLLKPSAAIPGTVYAWQDGSSGDSYEATDFGKYWLTASNACGASSDTVTFSKIYQSTNDIPNVITSNGDGPNDLFQLPDHLSGLINLLVINRWGKEVYRSEPYKNNWNGNDVDAGVYFIRLTGECIAETKSPLTVIR